MIAQLNDIAQIWWQWMGSMFWQVSLLIILVTALDMVIRKWAWPQVRYALWTLVFIKLIISPAWQMPTSIVSWIQPQVEDQISIKVVMSEKIEEGSMNYTVPNKDLTAPVIAEQTSWKSYALLIWVSGIVVFALMLVRKMYKFRKMHHVDDKSYIPDWFNELMTKTAGCLKLRKTPSVVFSKDAKSPAVYGVFRPVLMLPDGYLDKLSREQAEHVLMHELCHLKRGDLLVHWFCIVVQIVYWFNPLLIWTRRQMRHVCEICCDLSVANVLREKTASYRETLLHSARELFAENMEPSLGFFGIFEEPFRLVPRLKWLEKRSWEKRKRRITVTICSSLFMVFCVMPMACIKQAPASLNTEIPEQQGEYENSALKKVVSLEALVIEMDYGKASELGLKWAAESQGKERKYPGGQFESKKNQSDLPPLPEPALVFGDDITFNGKSYSGIGQVLRAIQNEPGIEIIGNPQVLALNGEQVDLSVSDNVVDNSKMSMTVTPTIEQDNVVLQMELELKKQLDDSPTPTTSKRNMNTTLKVKDDNTIIIGGILVANNDKDETSKDNKELIIFLTPRIVEEPALIQPDKRLLDLDFVDADVTHLIKLINEVSGKNIIWDPAIKGKTISVIQKNVPWDEALDIILKETGLARRNVGENVILVTTKEKMKQVIAAEEAENLKGTSGIKTPKTEYTGQPLYLDFVNADVTHILKLINEVTKENIIWDPAIKGRTISMLLKDTPWDETLDLVLKATGLVKRNVGENVILITTQEKVKKMIDAEAAGTPKKVPVIKWLKKAEKGKLLNLNFEGADITDVLMTISKDANVNITWDTAIKGRKVNVLLKDVPWEEALDIILKNNELAKRNIGENIIFITTKEKMAQILAEEEATAKPEQKLKESSDIAVREKKRPKTYLETIELSQLNISTIVIGKKDRWALVKDNRGEGHVIKEGMPIGANSGVVLEIKKGEVIIREEYKDSNGNTQHRDITKKVSPPTADKLKTQRKVEQLESNIASLKAQIEETASQMLHYQKMVADTPLREGELVRLHSEYNRLSEMYSSLKNRKSEAEMAVSWERKRLQTDDKQGRSEDKEKKEELASGTLTFLSNELNTVEKQLKEKEEELKKYKELYMGGLPEQLHANLTTLRKLQKQVEQLNKQLSDAEGRKLVVLEGI